MNTLFTPLLVLYIVLLALYVHGRLTLRDRIVRECVAESMKREAEMRRIFRRDFNVVVVERDKVIYEFRKMEERARNVTLLECKNKGLIRLSTKLNDRILQLIAEKNDLERRAGQWKSCAYLLFDSLHELQCVEDAIPDKNVEVRLPWTDRRTSVGDIFDRVYASITIATSVMSSANKQGPGAEALANMPSVLQQ